MKFSIITPSLNQGRFLPDCIESVLAQLPPEESKEGRTPIRPSHQGSLAGAQHHSMEERAPAGSAIDPPCFEFEHILTDAGSTDQTIEVLRGYPHLKWTSEPDQGMSDGINKGFLRATGDWMMWLNCDDYLLPDALRKVAACATANPDADVIHGDCVFVREDKSPMRRKFDTPVDEWDFLFVGCCIPSTATFYRADIIREGMLLDVAYRNCMDWEFYLRLARQGKRFQYLPEALAGFRWHDESTTQKHRQRMIDEGLRCQRAHIDARGLPAVLKHASVLKTMRKVFQLRRMAKRLAVHGRVW